MNLTVRCGQVCAVDGSAARTSTARKATANVRRRMLSNETSDVATQAHEQGLEKQSCPAGILHHFRLMNDSTLALTTLRDAQCRLMVMAGPSGSPFHQKPVRKSARRMRHGKCFFGRLMIAAKGASPV